MALAAPVEEDFGSDEQISKQVFQTYECRSIGKGKPHAGDIAEASSLRCVSSSSTAGLGIGIVCRFLYACANTCAQKYSSQLMLSCTPHGCSRAACNRIMSSSGDAVHAVL
jgi:hypothetical protein